jgi:heme-degrading monooxygenase HmoA
MISRHWRGVVKTEASDDYINHLLKNTFPQLAQIPGFVSASILRRSTAPGVEFVILTTWHSMEAIRQFADEPADVAVVPPVAQAMMVEYDKKVAHYEIAYTYQRE